MKLWGAAGLGVIALFMLLGFLNTEGGLTAPTLVALAMTVGLPAAGAGLLLRSHLAERSRLSGRKAQLRQQTLEAEVLQLAGEHGGRLTAIEVATRYALTPEGAKDVLDSLARREHAELEVTDAGLIVYNFHDVRHLKGKDTARGILDA
jgi:hypothetical protein